MIDDEDVLTDDRGSLSLAWLGLAAFGLGLVAIVAMLFRSEEWHAVLDQVLVLWGGWFRWP